MTKIQIINQISKYSVLGLSMKRKFQLLTWSTVRLEKALKSIEKAKKGGHSIWIK